MTGIPGGEQQASEMAARPADLAGVAVGGVALAISFFSWVGRRIDVHQSLAERFDVCQYGVVVEVLDRRLLPMVGAECAVPPVRGGLGAAESARLAVVLKALADPVRLRLYSRIAAAADTVCVCDIQDVGVAQSTVSHHLRKLREAGLIESERRGSWVHYRAVPGGLDSLRTVVELEAQPVG